MNEVQTADPAKTYEWKKLKHNSPLISCRFDPSGKYVVFGAQDSRVWRWEIESEKKAELAGHDSWVRGMAFRDAETLITGGYDGQLVWWAIQQEAPAQLRAVPAHDGWVRAVAVSPDGSLLASAGNDNKVKLWNAATGELVRELTGHESHIYNVAFHPTDGSLVSGDLKAKLIQWNSQSGEKLRELTAESLTKYDKTFRADIGGPRGMAFSSDGSLLACSGITNVSNAFAGVGNPCVDVIDWASGKRKVQQLTKAKLQGVAWGVALHPQGFTIAASGGNGGYLVFWKLDQAEEFHLLKLKDNARDLDLAPNQIDIATAHHDGHLRIHRMLAK